MVHGTLLCSCHTSTGQTAVWNGPRCKTSLLWAAVLKSFPYVTLKKKMTGKSQNTVSKSQGKKEMPWSAQILKIGQSGNLFPSARRACYSTACSTLSMAPAGRLPAPKRQCWERFTSWVNAEQLSSMREAMQLGWHDWLAEVCHVVLIEGWVQLDWKSCETSIKFKHRLLCPIYHSTTFNLNFTFLTYGAASRRGVKLHLNSGARITRLTHKGMSWQHLWKLLA